MSTPITNTYCKLTLLYSAASPFLVLLHLQRHLVWCSTVWKWGLSCSLGMSLVVVVHKRSRHCTLLLLCSGDWTGVWWKCFYSSWLLLHCHLMVYSSWGVCPWNPPYTIIKQYMVLLLLPGYSGGVPVVGSVVFKPPVNHRQTTFGVNTTTELCERHDRVVLLW
jgi:hypothetical protein